MSLLKAFICTASVLLLLKYFLNLFTTGFFVTAACLDHLEMILLMSEMDPVDKGTNSHKQKMKKKMGAVGVFFFLFLLLILIIPYDWTIPFAV